VFKFQVASYLSCAVIGALGLWLLISAPDWAERYLASSEARPSGVDSFRFVAGWMLIVALLLLAAAVAPPLPATQRLLALAMTAGLALLTAIHVQVLLNQGGEGGIRWLPPLRMDTAFFGVLTLYWAVVSWAVWRTGE
jgi:Na+/H+ antiporter NhaD/arsenite permease-like protein